MRAGEFWLNHAQKYLSDCRLFSNNPLLLPITRLQTTDLLQNNWAAAKRLCYAVLLSIVQGNGSSLAGNHPTRLLTTGPKHIEETEPMECNSSLPLGWPIIVVAVGGPPISGTRHPLWSQPPIEWTLSVSGYLS